MKHNLQTGNFSSSDEDDQSIMVPTAEMISKYNRQYSTIVKEIQRFLKQATESVQRFVTFHNFGVNLDLPHLLNNLCQAGNSFRLHLATSNRRESKDPKKVAKDKYEFSFNKIVHRMSELFKDLVDCEIEFKKSYFETAKDNQTNQKSKQRSPPSVVERSCSSLTKSSWSEKMKLHQLIQSEVKEEQREAELRATLNQRLKPKATSLQPECKLQYSTTENLYRLNEKIESMLSDMKSIRGRQQKLIELFNLNRVKKLHMGPEKASSALNSSTISSIANVNEEDQDHEEVDQILDSWRGRQSDISQREPVYSSRGFLKKRTAY